MAHILDLDALGDEVRKGLARSFQSGHINFLIGSGASLPAIGAAGPIEQAIAALFAAGKDQEAKAAMYGFLAGIQGPMNQLIANEDNDNNTETLRHYKHYLGLVDTILSERRTNLLPKQATIFTTNYDLFIEKASGAYSALKLNDGFSRVPSLDNRTEYSPRNFFNITYNTGNLYNYKVEIPCINLIKLHGSLSWKKEQDDIVFHVAAHPLLPADKTPEQVTQFLEGYAVVLPQTTKFRTTVMDRNYYELLRIYANELDRENALLVSFGFSFGDEHILDITKRALKNPTLRLVVFAYDEAASQSYGSIFDGYNNVAVIAPPEETQVGFGKFNEVMRSLLPSAGETE